MKRFLALLLLFAALGLGLASQGTARAWEPEGAVWAEESMPVPYCVNADDIPIGSTGQPIISADYFAYLVQSAFQTWQDIPGTYISFSYQGFCHNDPWDQNDGSNTIGWGTLWQEAGGVTYVNATHLPILRDGTYGQIFEADMIVDTRFAQRFEDPSYYVDVELPHILLHEAGHVLGLDHSDADCSIMAPYGFDSVGLCQDDIDGATVLYPRD